MKTILFVSCYSVDINNSASIELIYYMNLLAESNKYNVHLLTMDFPKNSIYYDGEILKLVNDKIKIHRVKGGFVLNKLLPKKSNKTTNLDKKNKFNYKGMLIKIKNLCTIVDPYLSWLYNANEYFKNNLNNIEFDIILGMHEPPSSLICAYKIKEYLLKKKKKVKLVSYFSDPYCNELSRRRKNFFVRKINEHIEKSIVNKTNRFFFVSKENFKYYESKYDLKFEKAQIIHRGYNKKFYEQHKKVYPEIYFKDKINILHAGDIAKGMRNVSEFLKAMDSVEKINNEDFIKLNINFYGNINDSEQMSLIKNRKYISYNSRISYFKIVNYMVNSDILIIFGNKEFKQIPAKIYDYLGTDAYILVIIESFEDPLFTLVKNIEGVYCTLNNKEAIEKTLKDILKNFRKHRNFNRDEFSNENILQKFEKTFSD